MTYENFEVTDERDIDYERFKELLKEYIPEEIPGAEVCIRQVLKNNDQKLDCLTIHEADSNISPTIYIRYYYDLLEQGESFRNVLNRILELYRRNRVMGQIDMSFISDFEQVKSRIIFDLVSFEKNQELLQDVPYKSYLDLAIVFRVLLDIKDDESSSILIHTNHMKMWGVTVDDLMQQAEKNTPKLLPPVIENMAEVLGKLMTIQPLGPDMMDPAFLDENFPMFVLTNRTHLNGAGCMLYRDLLQSFAERVDSDLYVLPSSVHEVLLVPTTIDTSLDLLTSLVQDVNATEVKAGEVLSGHAYYYSRGKKVLSA